MIKKHTFAEQILLFNDDLSRISIDLPDGFNMINPFNGDNKEEIKKITTAFYQKYYNDHNVRRLILGSSPARRGTAVTGVPFEDAKHLQQETGIFIDNFYVNKSSSGFLYDVINRYGGCESFYSNYYLNFVCPIGTVKVKPNGNLINCNYYESKQLKQTLTPFIINSIKTQLNFGIDSSVCFCIGSGENYNYLSKINDEYSFFNKIIPLEHPRFIMQYNSKHKDEYIKKYLDSFNQ